jgi:hypothetical protein
LAVALVVAACGTSVTPTVTQTPVATLAPTASPSPSPSPTPLPSLSATIPGGGSTLAVLGGPTVVIPAGAVPAGTTGSISASPPFGGPTDAWPADPVGPTWTIEAGATPLAKPVTLSLPFDPATLPAVVDPANLLLAYRDPATGSWVPVPSTVDPTAGKVTATVDHLSDWSLFTINWDYWLAFIKQAASGNLGDLLNAVVTLTTPCATTSPAKSPIFTLDNSGTNGMVKGCITSSTKTSAKLRIINLRAFRLQLFGKVLGAKNGSLLASGQSVTFSVNGAKEAQPVVVRADLDPLGLGYDITDIVLRLLPGSDLVKDAGVYAKVLDEVLKAQDKLWTGANFIDQLKAGKVVAAASSIVELLTSETYLTTLLDALVAAGKAHGIPVLASLSKEGIKRVLTVVNLLDLIVTTLTFDVQYFVTATSQVRVSWLTPPPAPTDVTFVDLRAAVDPAFVDCSVPVGNQGLCGELRVAWHWSAASADTRLLIYYVDGGNYDCFDPSGCGDWPTAQELCTSPDAQPILVDEVDPAVERIDVLTPPPFGATCVYVVARNGAGSSGRVWATDATRW